MEREVIVTLFLMVIFCCLLSDAESVPNYQCSRTYLGRMGHGVISSYNYPFDYRDNLTCIYRIYLDVKQNSSQTVCLTFRRFSLENSSPFCSFDYVELGLSPPVKYCGVGLWQYGVEDKTNIYSNIWSPNLCWSVRNAESFDLLFSSDNSISGTGFYAMFQVYGATVPPAAAAAVASTSSPSDDLSAQVSCRLTTEWTCFNRKCISHRQLCNGLNDCGDWSDESYAHARCKGQNVLACDFSDNSTGNGYCEFSHDGWSRSSEFRRSIGPPGDHTNGTRGFYIYSESSSYLISQEISMPGNYTSYCLSFWYFIYGTSPSITLSVYISQEQAYSRPEWSRHVTGTTQSHRWILGEVALDLRSSLRIIFATQPSNNVSGIALDDISISPGSCSGVDISCNFESGLCGWQSASKLSHSSGTWLADREWQIQNQQAAGSYGPRWDHSSTDGSGYYLFTSFVAPVSTGSQAVLISPALSTLPGDILCLRFWYYIGQRAPNSCLLSVMLHHYDNVLSGDIWSQVANGDDAWKQANVEFEADGPLQVILLAYLRPESNEVDCSVAIDQLRLDAGRCETEEVDGVVCDADQYLCSSGHCIDSSLLCDKIPHCRDGSDEDWRAGCFGIADSQSDSTLQTTNVNCPPSTSFLCHTSSFCIPRGWLCDLFNDCGDMSDEGPLAGCPVDGTVAWSSSLHPDANKTSQAVTTVATPGGRIISSRPMSCKFSCDDGLCIPYAKMCDGVNDCADGKDEINCTESVLPPLTYCQAPSILCLSENRCLSSSTVCNGKIDCPDGSDEAVRLCSDNLSVGAVAGIVFGCCVSLFVLLLVALLARHRRRKSCHIPSRPHRPPAHVSTVFSVNNQGNVSRHAIARSAYFPRNEEAAQVPIRNRDNMGYIEENGRDALGRVFPSEMQLIFGEAPPSYNSMLQDNGNHVDRRQALMRGNSVDELEIPVSGISHDVTEMARCCEPLVGHSRHRRSYRSLPPTPARQPLVSYLQMPNDQQCGGQRASLLAHGSIPGHDVCCTVGGEHMYEDPTGVFPPQAMRNETQRMSPVMVSLPQESFCQSSVISPTQRPTRIRLGTTALQNRSGTNHVPGIYSPICSWHSGLGLDTFIPSDSRQLCYSDRGDGHLQNCENNEMTRAIMLDDFTSPTQMEEPFLQTHGMDAPCGPNRRTSKSSVCLPATLQRYPMRRRVVDQDTNTGECHGMTFNPHCMMPGAPSVARSGSFYERGLPFEMQRREHASVRPVIGDHSANYAAQNHRRTSSSSSGFYGNSYLPTSANSDHPLNCDDDEFFSPTCI